MYHGYPPPPPGQPPYPHTAHTQIRILRIGENVFPILFWLVKIFLFDIVMYVNWHICLRLILWIQLINLYLIIILKEIEVCWYITTSLWCSFFVISLKKKIRFAVPYLSVCTQYQSHIKLSFSMLIAFIIYSEFYCLSKTTYVMKIMCSALKYYTLN